MQHLLSEIDKVPNKPKTLNSDITEALCAFCKQRAYLIKEVEKISCAGEITAKLHDGASAHCYIDNTGVVTIDVIKALTETSFSMIKKNGLWRVKE
ncbi:hypothetical protein CA267_013230 [Alteromonas pelagimontana]|uniref:Uncharacterized protein n=1 Tax=Alteromonas pelagimontana TaxID=1858656 RepID=A0A6M4MG95_9ALTE|nr:hypothetical protein [Alteromonas pelagimontana]QJR81660.1 hypothetical protein CA267_013230 [Alteromonas pelagimontana]